MEKNFFCIVKLHPEHSALREYLGGYWEAVMFWSPNNQLPYEIQSLKQLAVSDKSYDNILEIARKQPKKPIPAAFREHIVENMRKEDKTHKPSIKITEILWEAAHSMEDDHITIRADTGQTQDIRGTKARWLFEHNLIHASNNNAQGKENPQLKQRTSTSEEYKLLTNEQIESECAKIRAREAEYKGFKQCNNCLKFENALNTFKFCSRCKSAYYCSVDCQKVHWKALHKTECPILASNPKLPVVVPNAYEYHDSHISCGHGHHGHHDHHDHSNCGHNHGHHDHHDHSNCDNTNDHEHHDHSNCDNTNEHGHQHEHIHGPNCKH